MTTEAGTSEKEALLLREIAKRGKVKDVILTQRPGDLTCVEGRSELVLDLITECLGKEEVLAPLRIECAKEPELVFNDRTANVKAGINFRKTIRR